MNKLQVFTNPDFGEIRTVEIDGEPWLVGKDVAAALGYTDTKHAILDHVDMDDRTNSKTQGRNDPELGQRGTWLINESGLYSLILSSKLPSAKKFKHWVTSEVLPAIRKTGMYVDPKSAAGQIMNQRPLTTDDYIRAAAIVADSTNARLPYVLGFLEQGGFNIPVVEKAVKAKPTKRKKKYVFVDLMDFL